MSTVISSVIGFLLAFGVGFFIAKKIFQTKIQNAEIQSKKIIEEAEKEASLIKKTASIEAKDEMYRLKHKFEEETKSKRLELQEIEKKLMQREASIEKKAEFINKKELDVSTKEEELNKLKKELEKKEQEVSQLVEQEVKKLEEISKLTEEEAKDLLLKEVEEKARREALQRAKEIKENVIKNAEKEANEVIVQAIQRCAADVSVNSTVSTVDLGNDDMMKGRIIGREGRNIKHFEEITGVDVIVDDSPGFIVLSAFNTLKREIAKRAMEILIKDGRIHPGRIEEVVEKVEKEFEKNMIEEAENVLFDLGIHDLHPELVKLLGKLKYRTSYGQNVLAHSKEVAIISAGIAAELGLNVTLAKRAGLLHDIGKAIDRDMEGTHTEIGYEYAKRYGEKDIVLNAILGHHEDVEPISPITVIVQAADAISGARPGARRESLEQYIRRLERLENIADSFEGVEKAYAIQAGREVRVIVNPKEIDDLGADELASNIAEKIKNELEFPGQIKVTVIREKRAIEYAK